MSAKPESPADHKDKSAPPKPEADKNKPKDGVSGAAKAMSDETKAEAQKILDAKHEHEDSLKNRYKNVEWTGNTKESIKGFQGHFRKFAKAAILGLAVGLSPPVAATVVASGYAIKKAHDFAPNIPVVKHIDRVATNGIKAVADIAHSTERVATAVPRGFIGLGKDILAGAVRIADNIRHKVFVDFPNDIKLAINHKMNYPEGTDIPAQILLLLKQATIGAFRKTLQAGNEVLKVAFSNPLGIGLTIAGVVTAFSWTGGPVVFLRTIADLFVRLVEGIISHL